MKNMLILIIVFIVICFSCGCKNEDKKTTDSAGTVEGQRLHIKPYVPGGNFTPSQKSKSQPPKDSSAGNVEKQRLHIEPY